MSDTTEPVTVIFRKFRDGGDIIALFPCIPADPGRPWMCESFMHLGQHGAASPHAVIDSTRPATPEEYEALKAELERPPYEYRLNVRLRVPNDASARREEALRRPQ